MFADGARQIDPTLLEARSQAFTTSVLPAGELGPTYARDFGAVKMTREVRVLEMPQRKLPEAWEACVRDAQMAKQAVEDEVRTSEQAHVCFCQQNIHCEDP